MSPLLELKNLSKATTINKTSVYLLENISLALFKNSRVAIMGPSGSGKTTLAKLLKGYIKPSSGSIFYSGKIVSPNDLLMNQRLQLVFQNPDESLTPNRTILACLLEFLVKYKGLTRAKAIEQIERLSTEFEVSSYSLNNYPHQLSGGEKQRIALIRALLADPQVLIGDEILSALDEPLQKGVLDLLIDYQKKASFALVFISHDLSLISEYFDEVVIIKEGRVTDQGTLKDALGRFDCPFLRESQEAMKWLIEKEL